MEKTNRLTIYHADVAGNAQNCVYRHEVQAATRDELSLALRYDHVCKFRSNGASIPKLAVQSFR